MNKKDKYILMYKEDEVLSFNINLRKTNRIELIERLSHFDKAPFETKGQINDEEVNIMLNIFFNHRMIPISRWDYQLIMSATHSIDGLDLAFKGHGLSLFDHYWFKKEGEKLRYQDINFFTNKWDDSFAKAVIKGDYDALSNVSLEVPDIVTPGWGVKGWIYDNGPKLYKLGINKGHYEENIAEVLASRLANRLFNDGEALRYELKKIDDKYVSVCPVMIDMNEELIPLSRILPLDLYDLYKSSAQDHKISHEFFKRIRECDYPQLYDYFVKTSCLKTLCFVNDRHFGNISMIRNINTGEMRVAPIYDLAGSFGSSEKGQSFLSNLNPGAYLIIYFLCSYLDKDWDYSWYNPDKLIGFEEEIREYLSKSDFYTPTLIDSIIEIYHHQKSSLDEMKNK